MGSIEKGRAGNIDFVQGKLRVGEAMVPPLIKAAKREANKSGLVIMDSPPGTSCPLVATVMDADFVILVTEPTPFGLHDLKVAAGVMKKLERPFCVFLNKAGIGNNDVENWCKDEGIEIRLKIPFDRNIAEGYSKGVTLNEIRPDIGNELKTFLKETIYSLENLGQRAS